MAVAMIVDNPQGSQETYERVREHLALDGSRRRPGLVERLDLRFPGGQVQPRPRFCVRAMRVPGRRAGA